MTSSLFFSGIGTLQSKNSKSKRKPVPIRKEETFFPSFTVIEDKEIKKPIYFEK